MGYTWRLEHDSLDKFICQSALKTTSVYFILSFRNCNWIARFDLLAFVCPSLISHIISLLRLRVSVAVWVEIMNNSFIRRIQMCIQKMHNKFDHSTGTVTVKLCIYGNEWAAKSINSHPYFFFQIGSMWRRHLTKAKYAVNTVRSPTQFVGWRNENGNSNWTIFELSSSLDTHRINWLACERDSGNEMAKLVGRRQHCWDSRFCHNCEYSQCGRWLSTSNTRIHKSMSRFEKKKRMSCRQCMSLWLKMTNECLQFGVWHTHTHDKRRLMHSKWVSSACRCQRTRMNAPDIKVDGNDVGTSSDGNLLVIRHARATVSVCVNCLAGNVLCTYTHFYRLNYAHQFTKVCHTAKCIRPSTLAGSFSLIFSSSTLDSRSLWLNHVVSVKREYLQVANGSQTIRPFPLNFT